MCVAVAESLRIAVTSENEGTPAAVSSWIAIRSLLTFSLSPLPLSLALENCDGWTIKENLCLSLSHPLLLLVHRLLGSSCQVQCTVAHPVLSRFAPSILLFPRDTTSRPLLLERNLIKCSWSKLCLRCFTLFGLPTSSPWARSLFSLLSAGFYLSGDAWHSFDLHHSLVIISLSLSVSCRYLYVLNLERLDTASPDHSWTSPADTIENFTTSSALFFVFNPPHSTLKAPIFPQSFGKLSCAGSTPYSWW